MIELITGLPGNGKTLFTIGEVKSWAERENRPVFYNGIPELTLNWEKLEDPTKWMEVPPRSIVVIDEAQKIFRNRSISSSPPKHVTDLETHRHLGIDLVLITQHPSLIDPAIRRLANRHRHMIRIYGMEASTVHKWDSVKDNCDKPAGRRDSEKKKWAFDKSLYGLYKSAEVHTMKRQIPLRVKLMLLVPVLLIGCGYLGYKSIKAVSPGRDEKPAPAGAGAAPGMQYTANDTNMNANTAPARHVDPVEDLNVYVWRETPRVAGLPETKPKYDQLTVPVRVPVPSCIQIGDARNGKTPRCKCYTQQGTRMPDVDYNMCIELANNGRFLDFDPEKGGQQQLTRSEASQQVLAGRPDAPLPSYSASGSAVAIIPELPDRDIRQVRVTGQSALSR